MDKNTYLKIHYWLRSRYGKANKCENINCLKRSKRFYWCLKKEKKYSKRRNNFFMLCRGCHVKYDIKPHTRIIKRIRMLGNRFRKGLIPWNKGKHPDYMQGENHPMWKGGKPKCKCGRKIERTAKRCINCYNKNRVSILNEKTN